jgi:Ca2+-binding RTX toxin-like protein
MSRNIFDFTSLAAEDKEFNLLTGTAEADTLDGTAAADKITGGAGNDTINETAGGDDILAGGDGDDIISISRGASVTDKIRVFGGTGADTISFDGDAANQVELSIDGGAGANIFDIQHAFQATILGGNAVDTVTVSTSGYALVHTAAGDDVVTVSSDNADARTGVSTGDGNDSVTLESDNSGHYRLRLGEGQDTVHQNASTDNSAVKVVFWDFAAGDAGDSLELTDYLTSVTSHHDKHVSYFDDGHLRLTDSTTPDGRAAAVLELDMDGTKNGENWVKLAIFVGVSADDLTSFNLGGLDPVVTTPVDPFVI